MRDPNEALLRPSVGEVPILPEILFGKSHALISPGTASESIGMGRELALRSPAAKKRWEDADERLRPIIGFTLTQGCWDGSTPMPTSQWQDAIIVDSLAR